MGTDKQTTKIQSFTDLSAWKESHKLVLNVYKVTSTFSKTEVYGLTSQMRRSGVSVTSNIAGSFSRRTKKDKVNFYIMSLGSLSELFSQLFIARDLKYINEKDFQNISTKCDTSKRLLNGLIKSAEDWNRD